MQNKADSKICSFQILPVTSNDRQIIIEFLKTAFFQQEPLIVCLKLSEDTESMEKLQSYAFKNLESGLNIKAVSSNGDLMGVILNKLVSRDGSGHDSSNDGGQANGVKFDKFMALFKKVGEKSDVFDKYPGINRIMDINLVAVNEAFRGQGVCKALFNKAKELAVENKCSMVCVECSSYFSANAAKKLGFQCIYSLSYQDYKNEKGEVIFNPSPPHKQFETYVLPIENGIEQ